MRYYAVNELDNFQFHDAEIKEISQQDGKMIWKVDAINAMTSNTQNDNLKDMCVKDAIITFENIQINSIVFSGWKSYDSKNNLIQSVDAITVTAFILS